MEKVTALVSAAIEALVDEKIMSELLGLDSPRILQEDRRTQRIGIPFVRIGRLCKYRPSRVLAHFEEQSARGLKVSAK